MKAKPPTLDLLKLGWIGKTVAQRKALVLERGLSAESRYGDTFWTETLAERRAPGLALAKWLVTQGQDVNATTKHGTGLHIAACSYNVDAVTWLIAQGAKVGVRHDGQTPLEAMLAGLSNADLPDAATIAKRLVAAGAKIRARARADVKRAYEEYGYARDAMTPSSRSKCEAAARALCELANVPVPPTRVMHDGKSKIRVPTGMLAARFEALWMSLVPAQGPAATAQGEAVRIAGRIHRELRDNGGGNWDADFRAMARAFPELLRRGEPPDARDLAAAEALVARLTNRSRPDATDAEPLRKVAVGWVAKNPIPMPLRKVGYRR